jgi:hypothetical protein
MMLLFSKNGTMFKYFYKPRFNKSSNPPLYLSVYLIEFGKIVDKTYINRNQTLYPVLYF